MDLVYFDNAASTMPLPQVVDAMANIMKTQYVNPASMSTLGLEAEKIIKNAKKTIAGILKCREDEIYFTSGGTESDNWAIFGTAQGYHRQGRHMLTTSMEHPAVSMPFSVLKENGFETEELPVDGKGYLDLEALKASIRPDTILVSVIFVNNETGTVQDIEKIGAIIKQANPQTLFHVDAVQGFAKQEISVNKCRIDMLSASGHKFHGPKGSGLFYLRKGLKVRPILYGGGHQRGMRSGTENAAAAAALALAAEEGYGNWKRHAAQVLEVKRTLWEGILSRIPQAEINGETDLEKASPYVLNVSFAGVKSEVLLHALEERGILVAAGSACGKFQAKKDHALGAMGLDPSRTQSAIRFSFSPLNTVDEAEKCLKALEELVPVLRRVTGFRG